MEIDDLKTLWKGSGTYEQKDPEQISAMLKGNSQSLITKLKRSAWFELLLNIAIGFALLILSFSMPNGAVRWSFSAILFLLLLYSIYYGKKIRLLNRFNTADKNVKQNLESLVKDLSAYLKFYKRSYTFLLPSYFLLSLAFVAVEKGWEQFIVRIAQPEVIVKLLFVAIVFVVGALFFSNWYMKKLYGNHLDKLKSLLSDLQELEA
jgi:hypothetical protein